MTSPLASRNSASAVLCRMLGLVLLYAGISKIVWWTDWMRASHLVFTLAGFNSALEIKFALVFPIIELGAAAFAVWQGNCSGALLLLRALGFIFWAFSAWLYVVAPHASCPCIFLGQYLTPILSSGIGLLLKAGLFLGIALVASPSASQQSISGMMPE